MTDEELDRINRAEEIQLYTENRCEALEALIKEMKCCANCEYFNTEYLPYFCIKRQTPTHCTGLCDKWEIRK